MGPSQDVVLQAGEATPANVVLRSRPGAVAAAALVIVTLFSGHATPTNVVLRQTGATGSTVATLADVTVSATGTVTGGGGGPISGTLNGILPDVYGVSIAVDPVMLGTVSLSGASSSTLAQATASPSTGTVLVSSVSNDTLSDVSAGATGGVLASASLSKTLDAATVSATGTVATDATGLNVIHKIGAIYRKVLFPSATRNIKAATRMTVKIPVVFGRKVVIAPVNRRNRV